jgi:hypothetical protein
MKMQLLLIGTAAALLSLAMAKSECPRYRYKTFTDTAHSADGLRKVVARFQGALGGINNADMPGQAQGFRVINWDGAQLPFDMPPVAFKKNRGAQFFSSDNEFVVSNPNNSADGVPKGDKTAPPKDFRFSSLNLEQSKRFQVFSPNRLFTVRNSNKMSSKFFVPAQSDIQDAAAVSGFGAIFTDVDDGRSTRLEFYDKNGCLIAEVYAPPRSKGLSFAGVVADGSHKSPIFEVKFTVGSKAIVDKTTRGDVVVMDDFIFGEPQPIRVQ